MLLKPLLITAVAAIAAAASSSNIPFKTSLLQSAAAACQNTYCNAANNAIGTMVGDMTLVNTIALPNDEQRANIYISPTQGIILAYQGTNISSVDSITQDLVFFHDFPKPELGLPLQAQVFFGFQYQWYKSWSQVDKALSAVMQANPGKKVVVTGHSMGAAIAQLAALAINKKYGGNIISSVISLEPPRTGNHFYSVAFDNIFKGKYTGVVNGADWVPSVPPRFMDYQHPSGLIWINPANSTNYQWFADSENRNGPNSAIPEYIDVNALLSGNLGGLLFWGDHQGVLFGVDLFTVLGNCPAQYTPITD